MCDNLGYFSLKVLKLIVSEVGESWDDASVKDMFDKADTDQDGLIMAD